MARPFRPALVFSVNLIWLAAILAFTGASIGRAKAPGKSHCYRSVCVKVLTVGQVRDLLGQTMRMTASHYGDPSVDPFNRGTFTSNGERFDASDPTRTASATLPDGTELLLRNPDTGAVSHVRVNDFGPFWVNRELDVTERVARDLGFEKQGIKALDVIVVSVPSKDDVKRLYRRDRPPLPAMGYLGRRTRAETIKLAQVLMRRYDTPAAALPQVTSAQKPRAIPSSHGRIVVREHVYHFVPKQMPSPRALGAEDLTQADAAAGAEALERWNVTQQARAGFYQSAFSLLGTFILLALTAPYGVSLLRTGARQTLRYLTYDAAVAHLKLVLMQAHPTAPARLVHGRLLQLPAPQPEPVDGDFEAEVVIASSPAKSPAEAALTRNITDFRGHQVGVRAHRGVPRVLLTSDRSLNSRGDGRPLPKKVARIISEGARHDGDLSSADAIIISGQVIGCVTSNQVTIEPKGFVDGDVSASWVRVGGWVNGSITAQKVDLEPTALVSGDVRASIINAAEGALIEGQHVEVPVGCDEALTSQQQRA